MHFRSMLSNFIHRNNGSKQVLLETFPRWVIVSKIDISRVPNWVLVTREAISQRLSYAYMHWNWQTILFIPFHVEVRSPYFSHGGILKLCKINEFWTCWTKLNSLRQFTFLVKVNASRCGRSCYNRFNPVGIHCPAIKVICILLLFSYCLLLFYLVLWLWPWHS